MWALASDSSSVVGVVGDLHLGRSTKDCGGENPCQVHAVDEGVRTVLDFLNGNWICFKIATLLV